VCAVTLLPLCWSPHSPRLSQSHQCRLKLFLKSLHGCSKLGACGWLHGRGNVILSSPVATIYLSLQHRLVQRPSLVRHLDTCPPLFLRELSMNTSSLHSSSSHPLRNGPTNQKPGSLLHPTPCLSNSSPLPNSTLTLSSFGGQYWGLNSDPHTC
jgi:hypothetical protein